MNKSFSNWFYVCLCRFRKMVITPDVELQKMWFLWLWKADFIIYNNGFHNVFEIWTGNGLKLSCNRTHLLVRPNLTMSSILSISCRIQVVWIRATYENSSKEKDLQLSRRHWLQIQTFRLAKMWSKLVAWEEEEKFNFAFSWRKSKSPIFLL